MSNMTFVTKINDRLRLASIAAFVYLGSSAAMATDPGFGFAAGGADETVGIISTFLENIGVILMMASVTVVTIAIIFSGYQIAFNNKRISDVAPVLIGGLLIGAASQIAGMVVGAEGG